MVWSLRIFILAFLAGTLLVCVQTSCVSRPTKADIQAAQYRWERATEQDKPIAKAEYDALVAKGASERRGMFQAVLDALGGILTGASPLASILTPGAGGILAIAGRLLVAVKGLMPTAAKTGGA